jgi:hypothetical protein
MLSNNDPQSSNHVLTSTIASAVITQTAISLYESIKGGRYSENDKRRLAELKHLYAEILHNKPPITWELDKDNAPTQRIGHQRWPEHVRQLTKTQNKACYYYHQSMLIAEYAGMYLTVRGNRWLASGKSGDLLDQFISEWINFALQELFALDFDDTSVEKIKLRIKYMERVQKHENLFKFGLITRKHNKFDTFESIKQQLYVCVEVASKEVLRQCAREKLEVCCMNIAGLLLACAKAVYYARSTAVFHEPLELRGIISPSDIFLTASAEKLYPVLQETHTGRMLYEFISIAGLEAFGTISARIMRADLVYFHQNFSPKPINLKSRKLDLPPWVNSSEAEFYLNLIQDFIERALRIAKLKAILEIAYDLTGKLGDVWAYGDKQGKLSLEAVLLLLEYELDAFHISFNSWYSSQAKKRGAYNMKHRMNPDNAINKNFNKADEQQEDIDKFYQTIKQAVKSVKDKTSVLNDEETNKINLKKNLFYKSVTHYIRDYHPNLYTKYQILEQPLLRISSHSTDADLHNEACIFSQDLEVKSKPIIKTDTKFMLWKQKFIQRHQPSYLRLQELKIQLLRQLELNAGEEEIIAAANRLRNRILILKANVKREMPYWSFQSLGWPFNQDIKQHLLLIIHDYDDLRQRVNIFAEQLQSAYPKCQAQKLASTTLELTANARPISRTSLAAISSNGFFTHTYLLNGESAEPIEAIANKNTANKFLFTPKKP